MALSLSEFQAALDAVTTAYGRNVLLLYAEDVGPEWLALYHNKFPTATMAKEQQNTHTDMKIELNITGLEALTEPLNRIAAAMELRSCGQTSAPATPPPVAEEQEQPEPAPAPTARKKKNQPLTPPADEPEPEAQLPEPPTGAEILEQFAPLKGTPYADQFKAYKESIGETGPLRNVTNKDNLRLLTAKAAELLEEMGKDDV